MLRKQAGRRGTTGHVGELLWSDQRTICSHSTVRPPLRNDFRCFQRTPVSRRKVGCFVRTKTFSMSGRACSMRPKRRYLYRWVLHHGGQHPTRHQACATTTITTNTLPTHNFENGSPLSVRYPYGTLVTCTHIQSGKIYTLVNIRVTHMHAHTHTQAQCIPTYNRCTLRNHWLGFLKVAPHKLRHASQCFAPRLAAGTGAQRGGKVRFRGANTAACDVRAVEQGRAGVSNVFWGLNKACAVVEGFNVLVVPARARSVPTRQ